MKYIIFALFYTISFAEGFVICGTRKDGAVIFQQDTPTSEVSFLGAPSSPITTYFPIPKSQWIAQAVDLHDQVPVYIISNGRVLARPAGAVLAERVLRARADALVEMISARQKLDAARALSAALPGNQQIQAQVSAAASALTSLASQAGIAATTATTQ